MSGEDQEHGISNLQKLELYASIGFDGNTIKGLAVHKDGIHILYPMGNKVIIKNVKTEKLEFLAGHSNTVSALAISRSGKYVASGQINHIGFMAPVILWDFEKRQLMHKYESHKVRVEAVAFSRSDEFLLSLGGRDCGSVVVWDIKQGRPVCNTEVSHGAQGDAYVLYPMNLRDPCFLTGGDGNIIIWRIDATARAIHGTDVALSKTRRKVLCMAANDRDEICYCGTSTGDVLKIRLNFHHDSEVFDNVKQPMLIASYTKISKKKLPLGMVELYQMGVRSIHLTREGEIIIGAGDGTIEVVEEKNKGFNKQPLNIAYKLRSLPAFKTLRATTVKSAVTSLVRTEENVLLVGTQKCEIFKLDYNTLTPKLLITCHTSTIYDVAFPANYSEVFATASHDNIRIWNTKTSRELLRIMVPNFICSKVLFTHDGKALLSAWNDGVIRSFTPLTGRLIYAIMNAHNKGVSSLDVTHDGRFLVSGGCEGQVRVWEVKPTKQTLTCTLKEHKGPVSAIHVNSTDDEAVSASTDGTCIIWDLVRYVRRQIIFANTLFMTVRYFPTSVQILTGGSDKKISYWEVLDASLIRELEGSASGAVNSIDISQNGLLFASGGNDQLVRIWDYQGGNTTHVGLGHCAVITSLKFSPDGKFLVSTGGAGEVFVWKAPEVAQVKDAAAFQDMGAGDAIKPNEEENISCLCRKSVKEGPGCKLGTYAKK